MNIACKILLLEDRSDDQELIRRGLTRDGINCQLQQAIDRQTFLDQLSPDLDLILADYFLPHFGALEALKILRDRGLKIPLIVISGVLDDEQSAETIKLGAIDFLRKDRLARLGPAVERALAEATLRREKEAAIIALRESENRYKTLFQDSPVIMVLVDPESGAITDVNPAACDFYGYSREEFLSRHSYDINRLPPAEIMTALAAVKSGSATQFNFRHRLANGELRDVDTHCGPIRIAGKTLVYSIIHDTTERLQQQRELEALAIFTRSLRAARSMSDVYSGIFSSLKKTLDLSAMVILSYDPIGDRMEVQFASESWQGLQSHWMLASGSTAQRVFEQETPEISTLKCADPDCPCQQLMKEYSVIAYFPLRVHEQRIGLLCIGRHEHLSASDMRTLNAISDIAATAIHRTSLRQKTEQQLQRMTALRNIDSAITSSFDLRQTLNILLEQILSQLHIDAAAVLLYKPNLRQLEYAAGRGFRTGHITLSKLKRGEGAAGKVARDRQMLTIENLAAPGIDLQRLELVHDEGFTSYYGVPLIAQGELRGVLELFHRSPLKPDPDWLEFLESLGLQAAVALENAFLFEELQRSNIELAQAYESTIEGWARALDFRDKETEGHSRRVTELTIEIAKALGVNDEDLAHIRRGALLHDIGKMGIPDRILLKPGALTEEEWQVMKHHPHAAYELLAPIDYLREALQIPYCHHEKWDGSGYPRGLKGEAIPLPARVFAIVDVWDALCSDRPYRPAWPASRALQHIRNESGRHFDPQVVDAFMGLIDCSTETSILDQNGQESAGNGPPLQ